MRNHRRTLKKNRATAFVGEGNGACRSRRASQGSLRQVFKEDKNNDKFNYGKDAAMRRRPLEGG
jgi:hypothetical protein